jgi:phage terminase small subunit
MTDTDKPLSKKHLAFIDQYFLCHFNGTEAYERVYKTKDRNVARAAAARLLANVSIQQEISDRLTAVHMGADEVLKRLADIARGDIADFLDVSPLGFTIDLAAAQTAGKTGLIKKIKQKTITINGQKEDREIHTEEIELYSAKEALELIGKHHKLFNELGSKNNPVHIDGLDRLLEEVWSQ